MSNDMQLVVVLGGFFALVVLLPRVVLWHRLLYGTILPELVLFGSRRDRARALGRARKSIHGDDWHVLLLVGMGVGLWLLFRRSPWPGRLSFIPAMTVFFFAPYVVAIALFYGLFRNPLRRSLRRQLAEGGHGICVWCGYDLRGQTEPRCPECGRAVMRVVQPQREDPPCNGG